MCGWCSTRRSSFHPASGARTEMSLPLYLPHEPDRQASRALWFEKKKSVIQSTVKLSKSSRRIKTFWGKNFWGKSMLPKKHGEQISKPNMKYQRIWHSIKLHLNIMIFKIKPVVRTGVSQLLHQITLRGDRRGILKCQTQRRVLDSLEQHFIHHE